MTDHLLKVIVKTLNNKKANDITVLKVDKLTSFTSYFVLAQGLNQTHVKSLVDELEFKAKESGHAPKRVEKDKDASWTALDFGDIVVHVFIKSIKEHYNLDQLWEDAPRLLVDDIILGD